MSNNAFLTLSTSVLAFGDAVANANPNYRFVDWKRLQSAIPVENPRSECLVLAAGETRAVFSGTRTTSIASNTQFVLAASILDPARYRFTHGTGTAPALRTPRALVTTAIALTFVANTNGTMTVTAGSGSPFSSVVVADIVFIPGPTTGDADAGFDTFNEGEWIVLGQSSTVLTLVRSGDFVGTSEVVTPATDAMLAYSPDGVQVGDEVDISAGFAASVQKTYEVAAVTATWFEVVSTTPLAAESATPGVAGIAFYSNGKRFLRVESDQDCVVRVNGDTGSTNRISPLTAGAVGSYEKVGPSWSLTLVNRSTTSANVIVISVE